MTKEELRKEATTTVEWESTPMIDRPTFINGYIVGAEPREKRIAELEQENAELTDDKNKLLDVISNYEVKVADLEKENESLENVKNIYIGDLLKARKIIKDLLAFVYIHGNFSGDIFDKAMEFIKD